MNIPTYKTPQTCTLQRTDPRTGGVEILMFLGTPENKPTGWSEISRQADTSKQNKQ